MQQNHKNQQGQLLFPHSTKFSNKLLLKRLGIATPNTISFQAQNSPRCHHLAYKKGKTRYAEKNIHPLTFRNPSPNKNSVSVDYAENGNKRLSFSRMIQDSNKIDNFNFSYISHFYKKSIDKQIAARKQKKQKGNFKQMLNVLNYNPHEPSQPNRFLRTAQTREKCRCHKHSQTVNLRNIRTSSSPRKQGNKSRELQTQDASRQGQQRKKRTVVRLNIPQSWNIDSWNQTTGKIFDKDTIFDREISED